MKLMNWLTGIPEPKNLWSLGPKDMDDLMDRMARRMRVIDYLILITYMTYPLFLLHELIKHGPTVFAILFLVLTLFTIWMYGRGTDLRIIKQIEANREIAIIKSIIQSKAVEIISLQPDLPRH